MTAATTATPGACFFTSSTARPSSSSVSAAPSPVLPPGLMPSTPAFASSLISRIRSASSIWSSWVNGVISGAMMPLSVHFAIMNPS